MNKQKIYWYLGLVGCIVGTLLMVLRLAGGFMADKLSVSSALICLLVFLLAFYLLLTQAKPNQ